MVKVDGGHVEDLEIWTLIRGKIGLERDSGTKNSLSRLKWPLRDPWV